MTRTPAEFEVVKRLAADGLSDYKIATITGVSRATVQRWRHLECPPRATRPPVDWEVHDPGAYCYLLGCYLGDGHITHQSANSWELHFACDQRYPGIINEILTAIGLVFPGARGRRHARSRQASEVLSVCHPAICQAFPQHGPGHKHLRPIVLADWQLELTRRKPGALVRGLIHSDGCRVVNHFRTTLPSGRVAEYGYVRYFFSNLSDDIRQIFAKHCLLLGLRVTQSNSRNLSISHRDSVAVLEQIVGPKM